MRIIRALKRRFLPHWLDLTFFFQRAMFFSPWGSWIFFSTKNMKFESWSNHILRRAPWQLRDSNTFQKKLTKCLKGWFYFNAWFELFPEGFSMFLFPFNIMICGKLSSEAVFFPDGWGLESTLITGTETQGMTEKSTRGQRSLPEVFGQSKQFDTFHIWKILAF